MHMQLLHAHSTTVLAQARPTMFCIRLVIGASVSEPHIDEFAVNFPYISIYLSIVRRAVNHFLLVFCASLRHALIQATKRTHHCNVNDIATNGYLNKDGDYSAR